MLLCCFLVIFALAIGSEFLRWLDDQPTGIHSLYVHHGGKPWQPKRLFKNEAEYEAQTQVNAKARRIAGY